MAVSLVGTVLLLAGSAASAQEVNPGPSSSNWPPFSPAVPDRSVPAKPGLPSVVLLPDHPTPTPTPAPTPAPSPAFTQPSAQAGGWQPTLPRAAGGSAATAPLAPSAELQTRPGGESRTPYIRQMRLQGEMRGEETQDYQIQLEVPGPDRLFRRESERALQMRIQQEARGRSNLDRITFPAEPELTTEAYTPRSYPPMTEVVEPFYVCYGRLDFEEKNSERYGWDLGILQPFVSTTCFFWDAATIPYKLGSYPFRWWDCDTGYCLPGDPVPYLLYPPEITVRGGLLEAGTVVALFAIFPG
jgi:hypothetical protein